MRRAVLAALLLALAGRLTAAATPLGVVRLSQTISTDAIVADAKGYFAEEGLQIQWTGKQAHGPAVLVTVAAGENDFAGTVASAVFLARARGSKLRIFARSSVSSAKEPQYHYLVKDGSPLKEPKDLVGKKVVAQPATITWYPIALWLKRGGVDLNAVEFVTLTSPLAQLQAFQAGKVDVLGVNESTSTGNLLLAQGGVHYLAGVSDAEVLGVSQIGGWAAREDYLAQHPERVRAFLRGMTKGIRWANAHPDEALAILNKVNEVPAKLAPYVKWRHSDPDLSVDPKSIARWTSLLEEFGQIPKGSIRPEDVFTNEFIPPTAH